MGVIRYSDLERANSTRALSFHLDLNTSTLSSSDGRNLKLPCEEALLLGQLARAPHTEFSSLALVAIVAPLGEDPELSRMHAHLFRLRQKLVALDRRMVIAPGQRLTYFYAGPEIRVTAPRPGA
ncbi:hypothetical protein ACFQ4M_10410 [Thauera mechernichensis]|uniref:OmpR/PhoB-type domain-containing protein n=1 Tax=Thauera mechernichensis TaxID=82788 RepID=A0ABW3WE76_9RHOO|nr:MULTISPECIES: hypothetical protein [Thauera]MDG3064857.1 hypothetical protein [Thauera mechernichensis]